MVFGANHQLGVTHGLFSPQKETKYHELVEAGRAGRYGFQLITVEVGLWGMPEDGDFLKLKTTVNAMAKETRELCLAVICSNLL